MTVVSCSGFFSYFNSTNSQLCELFKQQICFADVILLTKTDLVNERELSDIQQTIKSINAQAQVAPCVNGKMPIDRNILFTGLYSLKKATRHPTWNKTEPKRKDGIQLVLCVRVLLFLFVLAVAYS